jgi:hypothetical protein
MLILFYEILRNGDGNEINKQVAGNCFLLNNQS